MKKLLFVALLLCFCSTAALAQSEDQQATSGSVYSKLGIGFPSGTANISSRSMGLTGVSYDETSVASLTNPAHWGNTVYGLGYGGVGITSYTASEGNSEATNVNFGMSQFQLQLPLVRGRFGMSASFSPVTQSNFRNYQENVKYVGEGAAQDTLLYGIENRGNGGANRAELGFGWRITPNISVGYAASVVFVSLDDAYTGVFANTDYQAVGYTLETSGSGFGNRFGAHIRVPGLLGSEDQLGIGASVNLPVSVDAERKQTADMGVRSLSTKDGENLGSGTITLPMTINAGLSYHPNRLTMFATEGTYERWSNFDNDFKPSESDLFVDRYKFGLGFQYFPYITGSNKFLSQFKYRIGGSYDTGHLQIQGEKINTLKLSVGLGILSPGSNTSNSSIDLSFEYGIRGTKSTDLVKEQIWGVRLSLNLSELMFYRPKLQ
ncbi:hypothetical protein [Fodinibius sediminis]|uniref:Long-chain fatty acid transport protein n=1 Tax=Fodinibius sediminis TaxID=1214077 RepID=A0A521ED31_9BACT|nr:hypothetical protein [Fodinibius sediminis]SMO81837.1 hypothetical protein SAMN06265218_11534 [Fodinibius sediminis]